MSFFRKLTRGAHKYIRNRDGNIAVVTGLVGLPLLLVVSVALDLNNASSQGSHIRAAIDAAALASVVPANLSDQEREVFAQLTFDKNYFGKSEVELEITATRERVDITAHGQTPTLLSAMVGKEHINVTESTAAIVTTADIICVMALDPDGQKSLEFTGNAQFVAPGCSVQVNSTASQALVSNSAYRPQALSFCVAGTSKGYFNGTLKHACTSLADPYAGIEEPADGPCIALSKLKTNGSSAIDKAYLYPGTYCEGLDVMGTDVTFAPGTYIFPKGKLRFRKGSQSTANGVTFVLKDKVPFWMEDGAELNLIAPSDGPFAGLAIYQSATNKNGGPKSRIRSGAGVSITGTVYLPHQTLEISSESPVKSEAPATSFIAYNIRFTGDANVSVNVDHEKGGVPPIMPRSDDGARLIQ